MSAGKQPAIAAVVLCIGIALGIAGISALPETTARADAADSVALNAMDGRQIYEHICQGCHMADGTGAVGAGHYPALAKDPILASRQYMALTLLMGRRNMPAFGANHAIGFGGPPVTLNEAQMAAVINYVRTNFGNHYADSITAAEIAALDQKAR
ncbi:MAG: cytochrome c [Steroidobacteraceae bacterium]